VPLMRHFQFIHNSISNSVRIHRWRLRILGEGARATRYYVENREDFANSQQRSLTAAGSSVKETRDWPIRN
jgi:hypothetical protein